MDFFTELGRRVERLWREYSQDELRFPEVASRALAELPPHAHLDSPRVFTDFLRDGHPPPQRRRHVSETALVLYEGSRFFIELLCWMDGTTLVHDHDFSGAFHVLSGSSIHSRFAFQQRERINADLRMGELERKDVELLTRGDTRPIVAGRDFIHSLFHIDRPSVTLVVRTFVERDAQAGFAYLEPGLAERTQREPLAVRRQEVLDVLWRVQRPAYAEAARALAAGPEAEAAFDLLRHAARNLREEPLFEELAASARRVHGERVEAWTRAFDEEARLVDLVRRRNEFTEPDHRFFLALLLNVPRGAEILRLVEQRCRREPRAQVLDWCRQMASRSPDGVLRLLDVELDAGTAARGSRLEELFFSVLRHLLDGGPPPAVFQRVRQDFPPGALEGLGPTVEQLCLALRHSWGFRGLFS